MSELVLEAKPRGLIGKKVKRLRRAGVLPGVLYGAGTSPVPIELDSHSTNKVLSGVSGSTLLDLELDGETHKVLLRDVQLDVIRREILHIDLMKVALDTAIRAVVPVELVGEAPAAKEKEGVLVSGLSEVEVEALPQDLPEKFEVQLEVLEEIDASITVADLPLSEGVEVLTDPDELIARVIFQEEEIVEEEEEIETFLALEEEPELVGRGEREEEGDEATEEEED